VEKEIKDGGLEDVTLRLFTSESAWWKFMMVMGLMAGEG
jgi:hypothetical protein